MRVLITVLIAACSSKAPPPAAGSGTAPAPAPTPTPAPAPAAPVHTDPVPDPITKPLTEDEARAEASRLARAEFERRTDLKNASGDRVKTPAYAPASFTVKHAGDRWQLDIDPPGGASAHVSFGPFGDHATVDVGFATR